MTIRADILVLDARHLLWRTADAFSDLSAVVDGEEMGTGGVYGFLSIALRVHNRYGGRVFVAWEGRTNFRDRLFPKYKRHDEERPPEIVETIEDMARQEAALIEILSAFGVRQFRGVDHEADDVIGTIAETYRGKTIVVYTGDSDLRQLVDDRVFVVAPTTHGRGKGKDVLYDHAAVVARHGVEPRFIAQLKALSGDSSDAIPGVPGVGPKTAALLLNHYGSLGDVIRGASGDDAWPSTPRIRSLVRANATNVALYYKLTKIRTNAKTEAIPPTRDQAHAVKLLRRYKFASLVAPAELHSLTRMGR